MPLISNVRALQEKVMAIKFRKKIKIAPGVKLNVSSKGITSTSIGGKGLTLNVGGKKGAKLTTSIPGSGLSHTQNLSSPSATANSELRNESEGIGMAGLLLIGLGVLFLIIFVFG